MPTKEFILAYVYGLALAHLEASEEFPARRKLIWCALELKYFLLPRDRHRRFHLIASRSITPAGHAAAAKAIMMRDLHNMSHERLRRIAAVFESRAENLHLDTAPIRYEAKIQSAARPYDRADIIDFIYSYEALVKSLT